MSYLTHKVGDTVVITKNINGHDYPLGSSVTIISFGGGGYMGSPDKNDMEWYFDDEECSSRILKGFVEVLNKTSSGGPSSYYDMPFAAWVTTNDQMEYLAENKWGKYAIHLKDIFKGLCRWGDKDGTTVEYDSRKIIYYGCRVLRMVVGDAKLRVYLNELLDDKQFQDKGDN